MKNKKANTVVFIVCGTIVNLLMALLIIVILFIAVSRIALIVGEQKAALLIPLAIIGGIIISMIIYQRLTAWVIERFGLADKLDPLFVSSKRKKKRLE
ncbi:MAG: hypothetical protein JW875_00930 [Spirochaetales bacterium]|nr:hypothetical protein [Spirochaetales bacterium]HNQ96836.1 hypothetical protein [Treponemataceae bacterium]